MIYFPSSACARGRESRGGSGEPGRSFDPASNRVVLRTRFSGFHGAYGMVVCDNGEDHHRMEAGQPGGRLSPRWSAAKPEGVPSRMGKWRKSGYCRQRTSRLCGCR
jgi:hypothetical protein